MTKEGLSEEALKVVIFAALEREKMRCALLLLNYVNLIQVVIVAGFHLFPFRTEKLSPPAPMVLHTRGRVGSRRFFSRKPFESNLGGLFSYIFFFLNIQRNEWYESFFFF